MARGLAGEDGGVVDSAAMATPSPDIEIVDACEHNLRHLSARIPRGSFSVVTGVRRSLPKGRKSLLFLPSRSLPLPKLQNLPLPLGEERL